MRCRGFTLIEICLAVFIILMLISIAVPSLQNILNQEGKMKSFERFDAMVQHAQRLAVSERRSYLLVWADSKIVMRPEKPATPQESKGLEQVDLQKGDLYEITFPAALIKKPVNQWIFWPSGCCEPAVISFTGNGSGWIAEYDPLSVHAMVSDHEKK